ncbi:MAG: transposase [Candidatus Hydrogenedentes bacterium]|nr:transposase [Candidatus Hydrogenedentota bacterium]
MIYIKYPTQRELFDPYAPVFSPLAHKRIQTGWQGVFRHAILELMPVDTLAGHFNPAQGRPTRELYSMAGLVFLMEFEDWTKEKAADAYMFDNGVGFALNLPLYERSLSTRTVERYVRLFEDDELASRVQHEVTGRLCDLLELDVRQQRVDSTHVFSAMASFGRTRLMGVTIKRFLTQVQRHDAARYEALPDEFRNRYAPSEHRIFADCAKGEEPRRQLRQTVAEDMQRLIQWFGEDERHNGRSTFLALVNVFEQQCEVVESKVEVKPHPGGDVIQNPSDPDATRDGHKGEGYQAQLSETCSPANEVQLITGAIPQTAVESDGAAVGPMLDQLESSRLLPDEWLGDTHYGSDENVQMCAARGIELVSPVGGTPPEEGALTLGDFTVDAASEEILLCPAGHAPIASQHDSETGKTRTEMDPAVCAGCARRETCPIKNHGARRGMEHTAKQRRLDARRRDQATPEFKQRYRRRNGIESTNSGLKRRTGLSCLRRRRRRSVFHSILLKVAD